jgi:hypothetical protein
MEGGGRAGSKLGAIACAKSRVTEVAVLAALEAGLRGSFLGEKPLSIDGAIRTSQRWAVAHHFYPRNMNSYVSLRKKDDEDINRFAGQFWVG